MRFYLSICMMTWLLVSCSSAPKQQAKQSEINYAYGTEELLNKNYTLAIAHLLKAEKEMPDNPGVHNNLGMAYYFKGERAKAKEHISKSIELDPENTDARVNLGSLYFEDGDYRRAEKYYLESLKDISYEKHARTYYNLALIEMKRGDAEKAKGYFKTSLKEDEEYCPSWLQLGQIEYRARQFKDAAKSFKEAGMGICTNDPAPLYWQALIMIESREFLKARMKLDDLQTRFKSSAYSAMAQQKLTEITLLENQQRYQHSTSAGQALEEPNF